MKFLNTKKKKIIFVIILFLLSLGGYATSIVSEIVRHGYDKQNKTILFIKSLISPHYVKKIKDNYLLYQNLNLKMNF